MLATRNTGENGRAAGGGSQPHSGPEPGEFGLLASVIKGAGINMFGTAFHVAMTFAYAIFLARVLSPSELGHYFIGFTVISLLTIVADFGLDYALWRFVALFTGEKDLPRARGVVWASIATVLPLSVLLAVALSAAAGFLADDIFQMEGLDTVLRLFSISLPLLAMGKVLNAATQGLGLMRYQVYSKNIGEQVSKFVFTAAFVFTGLGLTGVMYANIVAPLISMLMAWRFLRGKMSVFGAGLKRMVEYGKIIRFSTPMMVSATLGFLLLWVDTLWLGYFRTSEDVGLYSVATRVAILGTLVLTAFNTMLSPVISDLYNRHKRNLLEVVFKTVSRWIFMLTLPMFLVVILFADEILGIFGPKFTVVSASLIILAVGQFINSATGPVAGMVAMSGRSWLELINNALACLINVIICLLLIPPLGIVGAAVANACAIASVNLVRLAEVYVLMRMQCFTVGHLRPLFAALVAAALVVTADFVLAPPRSLELLLFAAFVVVYGVMMVLMGFDKKDVAVAKLLRDQLAGVPS